MWTLTPLGFFSVVRKPGQTRLTVRARVESDLESLRTRYLPELTPTVAHAGTATVTRYWRMRRVEDTGSFDTAETDAIAWFTPDEARHRIRTTTLGVKKVTRDLGALDEALAHGG